MHAARVCIPPRSSSSVAFEYAGTLDDELTLKAGEKIYIIEVNV